MLIKLSPTGCFCFKQLLPVADTMDEGKMRTAGRQNMKEQQAINVDYENTGYDRGHLNPNFYQCDDSRTATFTLTNAVPQDPCFNQQSWKKMEEVSLQTMRQSCSFPGAERFFVTGVVRSRTRIPNAEHDAEADRTREFNRVSIPSHMWTAVCCHDTIKQDNKDKGFSFAYIGKNKADSIVEILPVSDLEAKLVSNDLDVDRYQSANIFVDDCNENSINSTPIRALVSVPMDIRVANTLDDLSRVEQSSIPPKKRKLVHQAVSLITSQRVAAYDYSFARLDLGITLPRNSESISKTRAILREENPALLLFRAHDLTAATVRPPHTELDATAIEQNENITVSSRKRKYLNVFHNDTNASKNDQDNTPVEDEYLIVADLSADGSDVTANGDRCVNSSCKVGGGTFHRWCYTDWDKTQGQCCVSECKFRGGKSSQTCYTGASNTAEKECSSRFSTIAVSGKHCLAEHECGLHGYSYYWCYTDLDKNWDYCCQPWHPCDKHDKTAYKWCYRDQSKTGTHWAYCHY